MGVGGIPSDYLVSTQLQLWLFCCWGCGCCWAVTIEKERKLNAIPACLLLKCIGQLEFEIFSINQVSLG